MFSCALQPQFLSQKAMGDVVRTPSARWAILFGAIVSQASCGKDCSRNSSPGDRFKITANAIKSGDTPCTLVAPRPGDSFVVSVTDERTTEPNGSCSSYSATGEVPNFARGVMTKCEPGGFELAMTCEGTTGEGCGVTMRLFFGPVPSPLQSVLEHSLLNLQTWGQDADGGNCVSWSCGGDQYDVRIERLPAGADGG